MADPVVMHKAVFDVKIRLVVEVPRYEHIEGTRWAVDNFLNRALQADIPPELYTEGFIAAEHVEDTVLHEWEEIKGGSGT